MSDDLLNGNVTPAPETDPTPEPTGEPQWYDSVEFPEGIEDDIKADPSLKAFVDEGKINHAGLMKSYVHAQRKMGADKVTIPGKNGSDEEWNEVFNKLGRPDLGEYKVNKNDAPVDDEFLKEYISEAHKAGLLPKQAQALFNWNQQKGKAMQEAYEAETKESHEKELKALQSDWGDAFEYELNMANRALKEFASEEEIADLQESGLANNIKLVRMFNKIGKALQEDKFDQESHGNFGISKDAAMQKVGEMFADSEGPYLNKDHPNHHKAIEEMLKLQEIIAS